MNATSFAHVPIHKHCDAKHHACALGPFQGQEVDRIYFIRDGTVTSHPSPRVDPGSSGSPGGLVAALQHLVEALQHLIEALQHLIAARYPARASLGWRSARLNRQGVRSSRAQVRLEKRLEMSFRATDVGKPSAAADTFERRRKVHTIQVQPGARALRPAAACLSSLAARSPHPPARTGRADPFRAGDLNFRIGRVRSAFRLSGTASVHCGRSARSVRTSPSTI